MDKLVWNEQLNIGVEVIDKAHSNLFRIAGKLIDLVENEGNYQQACKEGLKYLENYTMQHFSEEEAYMRSIHYSGYEKHKQIHDTFREKTLVSLKKSLESSGYSQASAQRFLAALVGWLTGHIMAEDQEITGDVHAAALYQPLEDTSIVSQAVIQALQNVFHLNASLANTSYNGSHIGKALYCRLLYDVSDGGKMQILLGVEEQLIRRGVGLVLGIRAMHNAEMIQNASLQIFEQFLHYMSKMFQSDYTYQLSKEELLTRDEFRSDFMTRYPCDMLFETRLGYFIFCSRKWKVKKKPAQTGCRPPSASL